MIKVKQNRTYLSESICKFSRLDSPRLHIIVCDQQIERDEKSRDTTNKIDYPEAELDSEIERPKQYHDVKIKLITDLQT